MADDGFDELKRLVYKETVIVFFDSTLRVGQYTSKQQRLRDRSKLEYTT